MSLPTAPEDKNWPKSPSFLPVVIAFAVTILLILGLAVFFMRGRAQKVIPMKTDPTPSQTMLVPTLTLDPVA